MTIEHGIEIPERGRTLAVVAQMSHGDSVAFPDRINAANFGYALRKRGKVAVMRKLHDGTYRVWALDKGQA